MPAKIDEKHATWGMYLEFMQSHFDLSGNGCWGGIGYFWALWFACLWGLPLFYFFVLRNSHLYWLSYGPRNDPYDLSYAFQDLTKRAVIGAKLAARDLNGDGFIDANTELIDDDAVESEIPQTAAQTEPETTITHGKYPPQMVLSNTANLVYNGFQPVPSSEFVQRYYVSGHGFGTSDCDSNITARKNLESVGIDCVFHDVLLSAGLDLETLSMVSHDQVLHIELEKAGVSKPGDRIKIVHALKIKTVI